MKVLKMDQMETLEGGGQAATCLKLGIATGIGIALGSFAGVLGIFTATLAGYITAVENNCL